MKPSTEANHLKRKRGSDEDEEEFKAKKAKVKEIEKQVDEKQEECEKMEENLKKLQQEFTNLDTVKRNAEFEVLLSRIKLGTLNFAICENTEENRLLCREFKVTQANLGVPFHAKFHGGYKGSISDNDAELDSCEVGSEKEGYIDLTVDQESLKHYIFDDEECTGKYPLEDQITLGELPDYLTFNLDIETHVKELDFDEEKCNFDYSDHHNPGFTYVDGRIIYDVLFVEKQLTDKRL